MIKKYLKKKSQLQIETNTQIVGKQFTVNV